MLKSFGWKQIRYGAVTLREGADSASRLLKHDGEEQSLEEDEHVHRAEEVVESNGKDSDEKKILRIDDPKNVAWPTKDVCYIE